MFRLFKDVFKLHKSEIIRIIILSCILSFTSGINIVMLIPLLNVVNIGEVQGGVFAFAVGLFSDMSDNIRLVALLGVYIGLIMFSAFIGRYVTIISSKFVEKYTKKLRLLIYDSVMNAEWEVLTAQKREELLNLFTTETYRVSHAVSLYPKLISLGLTAIIQVIIALMINVELTLIVMTAGTIFFFSFRSLFDAARKHGERIRVASEEFIGETTSQIESIVEIKSYGVEKSHRERYKSVVEEHEDAFVSQTKLTSLPSVIFKVSSALLIALLFFVSNVLLKIELADLLIVVYIFTHIWPIYSTSHSYIQMLNTAIPSYENVVDVIHRLNNDSNEQDLTDSEIRLKQSIRFDKVSFKYAASNENVLQDMSFLIETNKITAISGRSGIGKTTIVNLLMGFLRPTVGQILVDGINIDNSNIRAWRKSISYIPQDPIILNKSVRENIKRFNPNVTDEDIAVALDWAQADFVNKLPGGLDTLLGEKGVRLSGGEKQRIVLARALVGKPSVLILDEATSALDIENERSIQSTIQSLKSNVTIIVIAHRESTIESADKVIKL